MTKNEILAKQLGEAISKTLNLLESDRLRLCAALIIKDLVMSHGKED